MQADCLHAKNKLFFKKSPSSPITTFLTFPGPSLSCSWAFVPPALTFSNHVKLSILSNKTCVVLSISMHAYEVSSFLMVLSCAFTFSLASFPKCFCDIVMQCWLYFLYSFYPSSFINGRDCVMKRCQHYHFSIFTGVIALYPNGFVI